MSGFAHTEGPWKALRGAEKGDDLRCGVTVHRGKYDFMVAVIENGAPGDICDTEFENAKRIASAVNACDTAGLTNAALNAGVIGKLLEALDSLNDWNGSRRGLLGGLLPADDQDPPIRNAMRALALARGETGA